MDAKQTKARRLRLTREYKTLIESINRSGIAAEEIQHETTEDEGDRATTQAITSNSSTNCTRAITRA